MILKICIQKKEAKFLNNQSIGNLEITPSAYLQRTPNLPNSLAKFNAIETNLMAIKLYFMGGVYELRNEISSLIKIYVQKLDIKSHIN